jgi:hypothetical protein
MFKPERDESDERMSMMHQPTAIRRLIIGCEAYVFGMETLLPIDCLLILFREEAIEVCK